MRLVLLLLLFSTSCCKATLVSTDNDLHQQQQPVSKRITTSVLPVSTLASYNSLIVSIAKRTQVVKTANFAATSAAAAGKKISVPKRPPSTKLVSDTKPAPLKWKEPLLSVLMHKHADTPVNKKLRRLAGTSSSASMLAASLPPMNCDVAFLKCMDVDNCMTCFMDMQQYDIDWASVTQDTPCSIVIDSLFQNKKCLMLKNNLQAKDEFCNTLRSCVLWDEGENDDSTNSSKRATIDDDYFNWSVDCSTLTSCKWEGMHPSFIGNGICNDYACYNTEICGYDGGDCCEDTCQTDSAFVECGHDNYYCRNPASKNCDSSLTRFCTNANDDASGREDPVSCPSNTTKYRLIMYDSFGDGWDTTKVTISLANSNGNATGNPIFQGGLESGSQGTVYLCLSKVPACYHVSAKGGVWGNEISWEIKPMTEGAPAIAGGGAPMDCNFNSAGGTCTHTCTGKPNIEPSNDPDYKELKDMYSCIESKCVIQVAACQNNTECRNCFQEKTSDFCYANDLFTAVVDCALCNCMNNTNSEFCQSKKAPGSNVLPPSDKKASQETKMECSPAETLQGGAAVMMFGNCTSFDEVGMMISDFDQNNFGDLDKFEACAHSFAKDDNYGGHSALGCLQILVNAMNMPATDPKVPTDAIHALATKLYNDAEGFCDCAKRSSYMCPFCTSFVRFKTLLYESLDACQSLDEIDCDAWKEFYPMCYKNMGVKFGKVDFSSQEQCDYLHYGCGSAGPFPSFRRLDCDKELSKESWAFYNQFASACIKDYKPTVMTDAPRPAPGSATKPTASPTGPAKPYTPPGGSSSTSPKPYIPPEDRGKTPSADDSKSSSETTSTSKKRSGRFWKFLLVCCLAGGIYYWYKRRANGFDFVRYRRMRNQFMVGGTGMDDSDMFSGLALESSTNFEPPSLPPTPAAMGGSSMFQ